MLDEKIRSRAEAQQYRLVGSHSAVKICHWTKKSLTDEGFCYKQKFYGTESHRCCQMTPSLFCPNRCLYCWRSIELFSGRKIIGRINDPEEIVDGCISQHRILINGFPGNEKINMKKFKEAQNPNMFAISLTGEPTLYPELDGIIDELRKRNIMSFLVSNGQLPEKIKNLQCMPTQLYISLDAPTKEIYKKIDKPMFPDFWERLSKTLDLIPSLGCRTALRITAVKNLNMVKPEEYAKLIKKANPMFVEVKGYMWVGESRKRLKESNMPTHKEVMGFAKKISESTGYKISEEKKESTAVLLADRNCKNRLIKG
jgi:tRNA wybutosine-synthesizing protein 1